MATITADTFLDDGTARTAAEAWTLNGGKLTVRTDTRWHVGAPASMAGSLGSQTISPTLGGGVLLDGRNVRWLPYDTGSGNVPAIGTTITQGGVSGYLLGVYDTLTSAPTAVGAAMPADGHIKFREVTGGPFTTGALTGIGASATGPDVTGWIEVVMDQATAVTTSRIGTGHQIRGDWFYLDNTNGSVGQVLQVPTNGGGAGTYSPGVWVETAVGSDEYHFWPALDGVSNGWTQLNLGAPLGATDIRQQFVKALPSGQMQIGEAFTQASTYAVATTSSSYTWASDFVTINHTTHGYSAGEQVYLDFTTGGATGNDGVYTIFDCPTASQYRVALAGSGASGNYTSCGRVTITFTAHVQTTGKTVYLDVTSGGLASGVYEIRGTPAANTYVVAAPVSPATVAGNATMTLTVGHVPVSGLRCRVPNVFLRNTTSANRALNLIPSATVGTRPDFTTTGAGVIDWEYGYGDWYAAFVQPYALSIKHTAVFTIFNIQEVATPLVLEDVGVGQIQGMDSGTLSVSNCFAGGTITGFVGQRGNAPGTNDHDAVISQCAGITLTDCVFGIIGYARSSGYPIQISNSIDIDVVNCTVINNSGVVITASVGVEVTGLSFATRYIGVHNGGSSAVTYQAACNNGMVDGMTIGCRGTAIDRQHPDTFVSLSAVDNIRIRNIGTRAAPASSAAIGYLAPNILATTNSTNCSNIKIQNCHLGFVRVGFLTHLNIDNKVTVENCTAGNLNTNLTWTWVRSGLNMGVKGLRVPPVVSVAANASVYGSHFQDLFQSDTRGLLHLPMNEPTALTSGFVTQSGTPAFTSSPGLVMAEPTDEVIFETDSFLQGHTGFDGASDRTRLPVVTGVAAVSASVSYTWAANVVTITHATHGYKTGDQLWINFTSGGLGVTQSGVYTITVTGTGTYTVPRTGSGTAGACRVWYANHYEYQIDLNDGNGYSGWRNFHYAHLGARHTSGSAVVTMNDTSRVAVGDYVWSVTLTDIPSGVTVASVDSATQITLSANATGTVAANGILYFTKLPSETIVPADGFKMKVRVKPLAAHSLNTVTYLHAFTTSTQVAQSAISYPLDLTPLTLTGLKNPTEVRVFDAGTTTEIAGQENVTSGTFTTTIDAGSYPAVDISILALGYQNTRLTNIDLSSGDVEIPVQQVIDRQYENV